MRGRGAWCFSYLSLILRGVHLALLGRRAVCRRAGGRGNGLSTFGASWARGVGGGVVVPTVGAVRRGGGVTVGDGAEVNLLRASGVGAAVFRFPVVESADGADGVIVLTDRGSVAVPLAVAALGGFICRVGGLDLPSAREQENMGAHLFALLGGGGNHHRGGVLEGTSVRVWIEEVSGGDCKALGVKDGGFEVDKQILGVIGKVTEGQAVDSELVFNGSGAEGEPWGVTNREGFVQTRRKGGKKGGVIRGRSGWVNPQEGDRPIGVDFGSEGKGEGAVGGP